MVTKATSRTTRSPKQVTLKAIPLQKAHIHNTAKAVNTDFLTADITPSDAPCLFRIQIQVDTAAVFSAKVNSTTEVSLEFNAGAQLTAGTLYIFDMLVDTDDEVNFQVDQNVNVDKFIGQEILWAVQ